MPLMISDTLGLLLVAVTMGLSLAHALEFPGKLRLSEEVYKEVQTIYYPGFSIGGLIGELGGIVALAGLLWTATTGTPRFWLVALALIFMLACHATYWTVTHPVNNQWLKNKKLGPASRLFFGLFSSEDADWRHLRHIWEWSHVARACFAGFAFISLSLAIMN